MVSSCLERPQLGEHLSVCDSQRGESPRDAWHLLECLLMKRAQMLKVWQGEEASFPMAAKINGIICGDQSTISFLSRGNAPDRKRQWGTVNFQPGYFSANLPSQIIFLRGWKHSKRKPQVPGDGSSRQDTETGRQELSCSSVLAPMSPNLSLS